MLMHSQENNVKIWPLPSDEMCEGGMIFRQEQSKTEGLQFLSAVVNLEPQSLRRGLRLSLVEMAQPSWLAAAFLTSGMSPKAG